MSRTGIYASVLRSAARHGMGSCKLCSAASSLVVHRLIKVARARTGPGGNHGEDTGEVAAPVWLENIVILVEEVHSVSGLS